MKNLITSFKKVSIFLMVSFFVMQINACKENVMEVEVSPTPTPIMDEVDLTLRFALSGMGSFSKIIVITFWRIWICQTIIISLTNRNGFWLARKIDKRVLGIIEKAL